MKGLRKISLPAMIAAMVIALRAAWRLSDVLTLPAANLGRWAAYAVTFALAGLACAYAFHASDRRLKSISYMLGFALACFIVIGYPMNTLRALPETLSGGLGLAGSIAVFTVVLGSAAFTLYRGALWLTRPKAPPMLADGREKRESLLSRLTGNGFFAFAVILLCWVPVWLAFYPGTFRYDAETQFYSYLDGMLTTHHPLLHTVFMGWLLNLGNDLSSLTLGVALYAGAQMVLLAGIFGVACAWLRRRRAPMGLRLAVLLGFAVWPLFPLWSFSATKDVLFGGFVMLTCLQMADLWQDGAAWFKKPMRVILFVLTVTLMALLRNNGIYALCLTIPFAVIAAKSRRMRTLLLLLVCAGGYVLGNTLLIRATEAEGGSMVEMLSIPLQQVMRAATRGQISEEDRETLAELFYDYEDDWTGLYTPMCADNVKWNLDEDTLTENFSELTALWARVGKQNPRLYAEAFLEQNLPYYEPGAKMNYNVVLGLLPMDMFELNSEPVLPGLRPFYEAYDRTLRVLDVPGTELLSDNAVMVWLTLWLTGLAIYRRKRGMVIAGVFLLAIWGTCLLGPIAVMRYVLGLFDTVPVLLAASFARDQAGVDK